jgi:hypothetical protein
MPSRSTLFTNQQQRCPMTLSLLFTADCLTGVLVYSLKQASHSRVADADALALHCVYAI